MGRFLEKQKAIEALLTEEKDNDKIESLVEAINFLKDLNDKGKLKTLLDAKVTAADVQAAIDAKITAAIADGGAVAKWADARYQAKAEEPEAE